jgi:OOP family OmpA-OmpF porin
MKTSHIILNAIAITSLTLAGMAIADETTKEGYLTDSRGNVVRSGSGLCWHTGYWTPAMAIEECDPVQKKPVIAVASPPAAIPAPAPIPAVKKRTVFVPYTLQTEAMFAYNKSEISDSGKQKMHAEIIDQVKEHSQDTVILVTGHADRIGGEEYNMELSQRRADAVKAYLIEHGIDGNRIETVSKGESEPIVSCDGIKGKANSKNKALIACLQPNRRIVLDLKGEAPVQK